MVIARQGISAVIVRQVVRMAETGDGRYSPSRTDNANLLAQTLRGIAQYSQEGVTCCQVECAVAKRESIGVALSKTYSILEPVHSQLLLAKGQQLSVPF